VRRRGPLPPRPRAPLRFGQRDRALPLSAGDLHGALRLSRVRRCARRRGVGRRVDRGGERPLPLLPRAPLVITVPLWLAIAVALLAAWAAYEHLLMLALRLLVTHPPNQVIDYSS